MLAFRWLSLTSCLLCLGCSFNRLAVDTTAGVLAAGENSTRSYFDWESAGDAAPAGIMQLEGMHSISPDNHELSMTLAKAYMAYAYGWVMDAREEAYARGDFDRADHQQQRAFLMYSRARDLILKVASDRDEELRDVLNTDPKTLRAHLQKRWTDREDDAPVLFWLMMAWSSAVNNSADSDAIIDMPMIREVAAWVDKLDPSFEDAGALVLLGGFQCSFPAQVGGDPKLGKQLMERALAVSKRRNHIHLLNYATLCAVGNQDRELYVKTLREILEAPDQGSMYRLSNKVARRRAARALARVDELFYE